MSVKKIEGFAIVIIILGVVSKISTIFMSQLTEWCLGGGRQHEAMNLEARTMLTVWNVLYLLVNLGVASWLFVVAGKVRRSKWIWALFGLMYGLMAAILYFLLDFIEEIRGIRNTGSEQPGARDGQARA